MNAKAVKRLLRLKRRPQSKGLILIAASYQQLRHLIQPLNKQDQQRLLNAGTQATTYLMPAHHNTPRWLTGKHPLLAIRLTAFPSAKALCRYTGMALVSTSANLSGKRAITRYADCVRQFGQQVLVVPGRTGKHKKPSTIRRWGDEKIIRR